jgi:hypothetical protein
MSYAVSGVNSSARATATTNALLGLIQDVDTLLGADVNFLLGQWLASAASYANTSEEIAGLYFNARNQITLWGPDGQINDYAAKVWLCVVGCYDLCRICFIMLLNCSTGMVWWVITTSHAGNCC